METIILEGWLILFLMVTDTSNGIPKSGPFNIEIEKFTKCDDEGTGEVVFGTKITRTSDRKYMYNNPVYMGHPVDQDYTLKGELQVFGNGGYRPRYMQHTFRGCEEIWRFCKDLFLGFYRSAGVQVDGCPLPSGNFTLKDYELNTQNVNNVPVMMYNRYKGVFTSYYKGRKTGCLNVYAEVVPK